MRRHGASLRRLIVEHTDELVRRTTAKVAMRPSASHVAQLEHGVSIFLQQLAEALHDEETSAEQNRPNEREASTTATIMRSATLHAQDVRRLGFTIKHVVSDYGDVCKALTALATNKDAAVTTAEFHTLDRCLDRAIAGAVSAWDGEAAREAAPESVIDAGQKVERPILFVVDRDPHVRRLMQQFVGDAYAVEFFDDGCSALHGVVDSAFNSNTAAGQSYMSDNIVLLPADVKDKATRHLAVVKARASAHDLGIHEMEITEKGLRVL